MKRYCMLLLRHLFGKFAKNVLWHMTKRQWRTFQFFVSSAAAVIQESQLRWNLSPDFWVCLASDSGVGVNWFLRKKEFYNFIDYKPTFFESAKNSLQKIFS